MVTGRVLSRKVRSDTDSDCRNESFRDRLGKCKLIKELFQTKLHASLCLLCLVCEHEAWARIFCSTKFTFTENELTYLPIFINWHWRKSKQRKKSWLARELNPDSGFPVAHATTTPSVCTFLSLKTSLYWKFLVSPGSHWYFWQTIWHIWHTDTCQYVTWISDFLSTSGY